MEYVVYLCKNKCRQNKSHYHCLYCTKTVLRKIDAKKHFVACVMQMKDQADQPATSNIKPSMNQHLSKANNEKVECGICHLVLLKCNLPRHYMRMHSKAKLSQILQPKFLQSFCIDKQSGIYLVELGSSGPNSNPPHVQKLVNYQGYSIIRCDKKSCRVWDKFSRNNSISFHECQHIQSLVFNQENAIEIIIIDLSTPSKFLFKKETIEKIKICNEKAHKMGIPFVCSAELIISGVNYLHGAINSGVN